MRPNLSPRPCKQCGSEYKPSKGLQSTCGLKCALDQSRAKQAAKAAKQADRRHRERKAAIKPKGVVLREAQAAFNKWVRARDYGLPCVSCGRLEGDSKLKGHHFDCGHYRSRGGLSGHLRFFSYNAAGQCVQCNRDLSGNIVEYRKGLIKRIGLDRVEALENNNETRKFDIEYLQRIKKIFNRRARHVKRLRAG